jgi:hypothetical protein
MAASDGHGQDGLRPTSTIAVAAQPTVPSVATSGEGAALFGYRRALVVIVGCLAIAGYLIKPVRPIETEVTADTLAQSWSDSIAKLGLLPVFPPEEDIHVGDVWAVIAAADEKPLLGRGVRIAHIDLRDEMAEETLRQPLFEKTVLQPGESGFRDQDDQEEGTPDPKRRIRVSLAAFPGLTITNGARAAGEARTVWGWLGLSREQIDVEQLRIPVAETYGVSARVAARELALWCGREETRLFCSDAYLRRIVGLTVGDVVLAVKDGAYPVKLKLQLVNRVFMARRIEHRRGHEMSFGAGSGQGSALPVAVPAPVADPAAAGAPEAKLARAAGAVAQAGSAPGVGASYAKIATNGISLTEVFRRPVVFGFRAISVAIPPSQPEAKR